MKKLVIAGVLAGLSLPLLAVTWSGDVLIGEGESVEITNDDIAAIETDVTSVSLGAGSTVTFSGDGHLALSAPVSGTGTFKSTGGGTLVLLGDNSGLVSPGHFEFVNSLGVVSNEFGLGCAQTGATQVHIDNSAKGTTGDAVRKSYSLRFGSATGWITNHVDIAFDTFMNIGSETISEHLVMDATLRWQTNAALDELYFKGNTEFVSGGISTRVATSTVKHIYPKPMTGHSEPTLRFSGTSVADVLYWFDRGVKTYFNESPSFPNDMFTDDSLYGGAYVCERANAFPNKIWGPTANSYLDLGGCDQTVQGINFTYGATCVNLSKADYSTLTSETAAKLSVTTKQTAANALTWGLKVTGMAGLEKKGGDAIVMVKMVSDTKGELKVAGGSLEFRDGAGWDDGTVVVDGGTLIVSSGKSMTSGKVTLTVSGTGCLKIADNITLAVKSATFGSGEQAVSLEKGETYSIADLKELGLGNYVQAADGATDKSGQIEVFEDSEWHGWPTEPGQKVVIPKSMSITVTDADAALVAQCASIKMNMDSSLTFAGLTEPLTLGMPVTAASTTSIGIKDGSYVVITGDNRAYLGSTVIDAQSTVIVSNRYGLGCLATQPCVVAKDGILKFGGDGLTNDVPITADVEGGSPSRQFQINLDDGTFVQNGAYVCGRGTTITLGDAVFNSTVEASGLSPTFIVMEPHSLTFNGKVLWGGGYLAFAGSSGKIYFNHANDNTWNRIYAYASNAKVVCGCTNAIRTANDTGFYGVMPKRAQDHSGYLDLNGYDQAIPTVAIGETKVWAADEFYSITSAVPAALKISPTDDTELPLRFCGAAGLQYSGAGTYRLAYQLSQTKGDLVVSSGTLVLQKNAGWCGTNVTVTGGTLRVTPGESDVGGRAFGGRKSQTRIVISGTGTLQLDQGVLTDALSITSGGVTYRDFGPYGSSEAREAGLVDAEHVIPGLTGLGLIRLHEEKRGLAIIFR